MAFTMSVLFICVFIGTVCGIPVINLTDGLAHETAYSSRTGVQSLEDNSTDSSNDNMILNLVNNGIDSDEAMAADEVGEDSPYEWLNLHFADLSQQENEGEDEDEDINSILAEQDEEDIDGDTSFHPIPLPDKFVEYDVIDRDGVITLEELIYVTGAIENVKLAFKASDINGDGVVDEVEFKLAPWYRRTEADDTTQYNTTGNQHEETVSLDMESMKEEPETVL